jgi:ABC-2 type transport system permease protein
MTAASEGFEADPLDFGAAPERPPLPPAPVSALQRFAWSVRRELWENRALYVAPLSLAGLILLGFLIGAVKLPHRLREVSAMDPAVQGSVLTHLLGFTSIAVLVTGCIVAVFYCLGALHNERRDRSILFWKSLPVSDLIAVASKAAIPLAVLPLIVFAVVVGLQAALLAIAMIVLLIKGFEAAAVLGQLPLFRMWLVLLYGEAALALWYAPIYGWLLFVSGWARRAPFLWAVLPPLGLALVEKVAFSTSYVAHAIGERLWHGFGRAFDTQSGSDPMDGTIRMDPLKFIASPELWVGLLIAVALMAAAVWMRRNREPI